MSYNKNKGTSRDFVIDEDTLDDILKNANIKCGNGPMCEICIQRIIDFFVKCCYNFEAELKYCLKNKINMEQNKKKGSFHIYFEEKIILDNCDSKSSLDFINLALINLVYNLPPCENFYFHVSRMFIYGNDHNFLEDDKKFIRVYLDMEPFAEIRKKKLIKNKF